MFGSHACWMVVRQGIVGRAGLRQEKVDGVCFIEVHVRCPLDIWMEDDLG